MLSSLLPKTINCNLKRISLVFIDSLSVESFILDWLWQKQARSNACMAEFQRIECPSRYPIIVIKAIIEISAHTPAQSMPIICLPPERYPFIKGRLWHWHKAWEPNEISWRNGLPNVFTDLVAGSSPIQVIGSCQLRLQALLFYWGSLRCLIFRLLSCTWSSINGIVRLRSS